VGKHTCAMHVRVLEYSRTGHIQQLSRPHPAPSTDNPIHCAAECSNKHLERRVCLCAWVLSHPPPSARRPSAAWRRTERPLARPLQRPGGRCAGHHPEPAPTHITYMTRTTYMTCTTYMTRTTYITRVTQTSHTTYMTRITYITRITQTSHITQHSKHGSNYDRDGYAQCVGVGRLCLGASPQHEGKWMQP
jgi:hypothetical protein